MAEDEDREDIQKQLFGTDTAQQTSFCSFFRSLPQSAEVVRFFSRKDSYYTVHGDNCEHIARQYIKSDRAVQLFGPKADPLPSCIVNAKLFTEIVSDLWKKARIEVELHCACAHHTHNPPPASNHICGPISQAPFA